MITITREDLLSFREEMNALINAACNNGLAGVYWRPAEKTLAKIDAILKGDTK